MCTDLCAFDVFISLPFVESRSPIFYGVKLGEFLSLTVSESSLGGCGCYQSHSSKIHLEPFFADGGHLLFGTPSTSVGFASQPEKNGDCEFLYGFISISMCNFSIKVVIWYETRWRTRFDFFFHIFIIFYNLIYFRSVFAKLMVCKLTNASTTQFVILFIKLGMIGAIYKMRRLTLL